MVGVGNGVWARNVRNVGDGCGDCSGCSWSEFEKVFWGTRCGLEREEFPVSEGEFAFGKGPYHPTLAGEPVLAAGKLCGEHFAGGEGSIAVARDGVEGSVCGAGKVLGKACGFAPAHAVEGEDVRERVAEEKDVTCGVGSPQTGAASDLFDVRGFLETLGGIGVGSEHGDEVAAVNEVDWDGRGGIRGRVGGDDAGDTGRGELHGLRGPVGVRSQVEFSFGVCCSL